MPSSTDRRRLEVPTHLHERLVEIAIAEDRTVSSVVQEVLSLGLSQYESRQVPGTSSAHLTERAHRAVAYAEEEARRFSHRYVGTEHLLLGLLRETDGVAARVLGRLGLQLEDARASVAYLVGRGGGAVPTNLSLVPRARRAMRLAEEEAERFQHAFVGTEHLLVGLIRVGDGLAARILTERGILHRAHAETLSFLLSREPALPRPASEEAPPAEAGEGIRGATATGGPASEQG